MSENAPQVKYLKDYRRPDFSIKTAHLTFNLEDHNTTVSTKLHITRTLDRYTSKSEPLVLDGEHLKLHEVICDGKKLSSDQYQLFPEKLVLASVPDDFILEIKNEIDPANNKALEGLYKSGNVFCTQNEPEGMRRITYFIDRSDVMAVYTTKVIASKKDFPVLLSNGNLIAEGDEGNGRHFATWHDPYPKPSYLFALVAGDLGLIRDKFTTHSGRSVDLRIYCDKGKESRCDHAMRSLKQSMKWDEERFGLEYDLDIYMIVAVDAFNQGAMENKGLNVFNSALVLANSDTSTDAEFQRIESVIGHEYFHNWTGNRVTCRDWFQLTLKEGLTVFRDQEFSADMNHASVQRIQAVRNLRLSQFSEDASAMAHPIRPESYMEINNFYTLTVYEKGSEVIRMIQTLLGRENFRKGMDKYFELYDGQAVTTDNFIHAMELASGEDLTPFKRWYEQAGTPEVSFTCNYDATKKEMSLHFKQTCPATPEAKIKAPFMIPLTVGLVSDSGKDIPLHLKCDNSNSNSKSKKKRIMQNTVLVLREREEIFVFENVPANTIPSVNRTFSAPIRLKGPYDLNQLIRLAAYDSDDFNRWDAFQEASKLIMMGLIPKEKRSEKLELPGSYVEAFGRLLTDEKIDPAFKALSLGLPVTNEVAEEFAEIDYHATHRVREWMAHSLATAHEKEFLKIYESLKKSANTSIERKAVGERALKNCCLSYLATLDKPAYWQFCYDQFQLAVTMTDRLSAMRELADSASSQKYREECLKSYYQRFSDDPLVLYKWFMVQATSRHPATLERVKELTHDKIFNMTIPNSVRSLLHAFSKNVLFFHEVNGEGYRFIAEKVLELDKLNPMVAATLVRSFAKWRSMDSKRKQLMEEQLKFMISRELSKNVYEIVHNYLHY